MFINQCLLSRRVAHKLAVGTPAFLNFCGRIHSLHPALPHTIVIRKILHRWCNVEIFEKLSLPPPLRIKRVTEFMSDA